MMHLNDVRELEPHRAMIAAACEAFLAQGGEIRQVGISARQPEQTGSLRERVAASRTAKPSKALEIADRRLADRIEGWATLGLDAKTICRRLDLKKSTFNSIVKRYNIRLPEQGAFK